MLGLLDHDVLSSIEIPYLDKQLSDRTDTPSYEWNSDATDSDLSKSGLSERTTLISPDEADQFDMDVFTIPSDLGPSPTARNSLSSSGSAPTLSSSFSRGSDLKRSSTVRTSETSRISPIQESPRRAKTPLVESITLDKEQRLSVAISGGTLSTSPSQASVLSARSSRSQRSSTVTASISSVIRPRENSTSRNSTSGISKFAPTWLLNPFRSGVSQPQTSPVSVSGATGSTPPLTPSSVVSTPTASRVPPRPPQPVAIRNASKSRPIRQRAVDDELIIPHRGSLTRHSPTGTPPRDDVLSKRRGTLSSVANLPILPTNLTINIHPTKPMATVPYAQASLARRWQHVFPNPLTKHEIKWRAMVTPACLPLTVEHFPSTRELETSYDVFSYDFVCDPSEMQSFLVRVPPMQGKPDEMRRAWALAMMRGMVAVRLAQGFQFVLRPSKGSAQEAHDLQQSTLRRTKSYAGDDSANSRPIGAAVVLRSAYDSVYLSMSNEIHHIMYTGDSIQVRRYVRRMPRTHPFEYQFLIWPKLGEGYTELKSTFRSHGMESYGWNRYGFVLRVRVLALMSAQVGYARRWL